jgi:O-antigen/teichoic acid export membrane protein
VREVGKSAASAPRIASPDRLTDHAVGDARTRFRESGTTIVVGTVGVVVQISTALASLLVARSVDPAIYGEVAYFFSLFGVVVLLGSMGLTTQVVTEVARHNGTGDLDTLGRSLQALTRVRLGSAAVLLVISAAIGILGDPLIAYAGVAGTVTLLTAYTLGIVQGLGQPRSAAALHLGQALFYLAVVAVWARAVPEFVIAAVVVSYGLTLVASLIVVSVAMPRGAVPDLADRSWYKTEPSAIGSTLRSSGRPYVMALLLAPYSAIAVLALGWSGEFARAAAFSISITLVTMATTASSMIVGVQYYPRICVLVAAGSPEAAAWFGRFLRLFAALSLTAAVMLLLFPREIISLLLTPAYVNIAEPLAGLAPAVVLLTIGVFLAWTLLALDAGSAAVLGAAVQLLGAGAAVGLLFAFPEASLLWLAVGYSGAAAAGTVVWAINLRRVAPHYSLHVGRIVAAAAATFGVGFAFRSLIPTLSANTMGLGALLVIATLSVGGAAVLVLLPEIPRSFLGRRDRHAIQR